MPIAASSLGLAPGDVDLQSSFVSFDYDYSSKDLNISGSGTSFTQDGGISTDSLASTSFSIVGTVDAGVANLSLLIDGVDPLTSASGTLLAGSLDAMSYDNGIQPEPLFKKPH